MERDLRGNITRETESITQAMSTLIFEKSARKQKLLSSPNPRSKHFNETSDVNTDTTLPGGFAAEAVIMLLEIKVQGQVGSGRKR